MMIHPHWSPDGKRIVFTSERDDDPEIYIMDADGKNQKRLTFTPGDDSHPKFSPDGKYIIFNSARTTENLKDSWSKQAIEIFTMNTDGSDQKQITSFKTITTYPSVSPDGKKIVCRKVLNTPGFNWDLSLAKRNSEIIVINMDGTGERNVSDSPAYDGWPIWQPDGKIVFSSNRSGIISKGQLFSVNADGSELKALTDPQFSCTQHSISNDGEYIYCQLDGTIAVLNLKP